MPDFCIVSEFNPLHKGHEYILEQARHMGADRVICIMSGNATQRGELAITDKYLRAEAAIKCGADLVAELPYPWCSSTADIFAEAAVNIAAEFGDVLLFGSECGDIELLKRCALTCESDEFKTRYSELARGGVGSAAAFSQCLAELGYPTLKSNDLLGLAYIRIIIRYGLDIIPMTVKRQGADYNEAQRVEGEYQSATAMRRALLEGDMESLERYLPRCMCDILKSESEAGRITDLREADGTILGYFRLCGEIPETTAETEGGLANRLISAANQSTTAQEMFSRLSTKRYTDAKLRRAVLFSMTGVKNGLLHTLPRYTTLLGADDRGRELLAKIRKDAGIRIVTKPADAPRDSEQYTVNQRLDGFYGLARKNKMSADEFFRKNAYT